MIPSRRTKIPQAVWRRKRRRGELRGWERKDGKGGKRRGEERREEERKRKEGRKEKKKVVFLNHTSSSDARLTTPADFNIQECQDQWSRTNGDQTRRKEFCKSSLAVQFNERGASNCL